MMKTIHVALFLTTFLCSDESVVFSQSLVNENDRVIFLGDSNTYAGSYISDVDACFMNLGVNIEFINVGLPSETCCGLSEPDHPFPRPTVQERTDRVLEALKPNVVFVCYGMNDGIYHPFNKVRFEKYQKGIHELIGKIKKSGAKIVLMTPPPFDPLPMQKKNKLVGKEGKKFAWFSIYEDYDLVMKKYADWIMTLDSKVDGLIDIRTPIVDFQNAKRKSNPDFTMSGDGVHFNDQCHRLIATAIVKTIKPDAKKILFDDKLVSVASKKMSILRDAWLTKSKHKRPGIRAGLPIDQANAAVAKLLLDLKTKQ
ncbi:GDSL-type esterase/lipase family protein [Pirellulaceae bacterium]|jgi:lysophospholipase L1-like esterase|nr:GDSL-type esterase/lipase family protein [Pirellulaceae bacterium]